VALLSLRYFINLIEGKDQEPWGITYTPLLGPSIVEQKKRFSDIQDKLAKFQEIKKQNPLVARYGKSDYPFTGPLTGFWHAHLRDDAIVIYNLKNHCVNIIVVVAHADIEGKRAKRTLKTIEPYR
jgi:mRNA-degrading endonuclease YafQ of YafQ-DinJ toxin-antitoxin module